MILEWVPFTHCAGTCKWGKGEGPLVVLDGSQNRLENYVFSLELAFPLSSSQARLGLSFQKVRPKGTEAAPVDTYLG